MGAGRQRWEIRGYEESANRRPDCHLQLLASRAERAFTGPQTGCRIRKWPPIVTVPAPPLPWHGGCIARRRGRPLRELEASLQQFGEFLLRAQLVKEKAAPYCVRSVRRFLTRPASDEPLADQVRRFCESLERDDGCQEWQVRQAEHALRIYFVNFLKRTDWHRRPVSTVVDEDGRTNPLAALEQLRTRIR